MDLLAALDAHHPRTPAEAADLARVRALAATGDPWSRTTRLHVTGSAVVLHPPTQRVLLRWHPRLGGWYQVGGHVDPGEHDPLAAACREAREETGLPDLVPWPDPAHPAILHVAVVPVPAGRGEPAHEHADVRWVLATGRPGDAVPESPDAPLRWMTLAEALAITGEDNLHETLTRLAALLADGGPSGRER
ncbi:MAG TPA: NUDIX domain-containing protein [Acidimicrobiales bacterium]